MGNRLLRNSAILWLSAAVILPGCSVSGGANDITSDNAAQVSEAAVSETAATATEETATATILYTSSPSETETEASENGGYEYAQVSEDNVFIDYKFIEDYQGTTDIGVLAASAVDFLTESEYYTESTENIEEFTEDEFKKYFDEGGNILPHLRTAYPEDYDGDGSTETFIIVDMPIMQGNQPIVRSFLIYADSRGEMAILSDASYLYETVMLDYGNFKQITFGGFGTCGADEHSDIYGVVNGKAKILYGGRFNFFKEDCFLSAFGHMDSGDFMYYDTGACEYRAIVGKQLSLDEIKSMDKDNVLEEYFESDLYAERCYGVVGGKYYCVNLGLDCTEAVFTYDGKFELSENSKVRMKFENSSNHEAVIDIDITKAIAEMKSVK